jgi:hypothetical protein
MGRPHIEYQARIDIESFPGRRPVMIRSMALKFSIESPKLEG